MSEMEKGTASGGLEEKEKYGDRAVRVNSPFSEKLADFWFHHKGKVIVGVILLLVIILTVSQAVGRRDNDVMIGYAGPVYLSGAQQVEIQNLLSAIVSDQSGEAEFLVGVTQYQVYSKEQIESIRAETFEDGEPKFINSEYNSENYENLYTYIMTGDTAILLLDPWLYHELRKNDRLQPMTALFETVPPGVEGEGYGIVLGETELYSYYGVLQNLPADTVMCFLKPLVIGNTSKEKAYAAMEETFRALVRFESPEIQ